MLLKYFLFLLLVGPIDTNSVIKENVVFEKKSDITLTRSMWLIAFTIDFSPYQQFLNSLQENLNQSFKDTSTLNYWY